MISSPEKRCKYIPIRLTYSSLNKIFSYKLTNITHLLVLLFAKRTKHSPAYKVTYAGTEGDAIPLFLGFPPSVDKSIIDIFDNGLRKVRKSARLAEILARYGVKDWNEELTTQIQ